MCEHCASQIACVRSLQSMCVLAIAMLENLTVLTMEVLYSLWLPSGHDRPILRVYARGDREDAKQEPRGWS